MKYIIYIDSLDRDSTTRLFKKYICHHNSGIPGTILTKLCTLMTYYL